MIYIIGALVIAVALLGGAARWQMVLVDKAKANEAAAIQARDVAIAANRMLAQQIGDITEQCKAAVKTLRDAQAEAEKKADDAAKARKAIEDKYAGQQATIVSLRTKAADASQKVADCEEATKILAAIDR